MPMRARMGPAKDARKDACWRSGYEKNKLGFEMYRPDMDIGVRIDGDDYVLGVEEVIHVSRGWVICDQRIGLARRR